MALYCDWTTYRLLGGPLEETDFALWAQQASGLIDRLTLGRAGPMRALFPDPLTDQLSSACAQIADLLKANSTALHRAASGITGAAATDGYSESYGGTFLADQAALRAACREILADALGADPYGLLYQGVGRCV